MAKSVQQVISDAIVGLGEAAAIKRSSINGDSQSVEFRDLRELTQAAAASLPQTPDCETWPTILENAVGGARLQRSRYYRGGGCCNR